MTETAAPRPVILVVDPLPADRKLVRVLMTGEGWDVREAESPDAALTELRSVTPRVILLDLGLPVTAGLDLVHRIRTLPGVERAPILGTSSMGSSEIRGQALAVGCTEFIPKPFNTRTLPTLIAKLVEGIQGPGG